MRTHGYLTFFGALLIMVPALSEAEDTSLSTNWTSLLGPGAYVEGMIAQRNVIVQAMTNALAADDASVRQKIEAARVLGCIRAVEGVPVLISNIGLSPFDRMREVYGFAKTYPCYSALIEIGSVASSNILDQLEDQLSATDRHLLVCVMRDIETTPIAKLKLELRIAASRNPERQGRLREVLNKVIKEERDSVGRE